jgi:hypothetical protein
MPLELSAFLSSLGHNVQTSPDEGLVGAADEAVWQAALIRRVTALFHTEAVEEWSRCLVVVTERKVRVRRPV